MRNLIPYFDNDYSFSTFKIPGFETDMVSKVAFTSADNTLIVTTSLGTVFYAQYDPAKPGECKKTDEQSMFWPHCPPMSTYSITFDMDITDWLDSGSAGLSLNNKLSLTVPFDDIFNRLAQFVSLQGSASPGNDVNTQFPAEVLGEEVHPQVVQAIFGVDLKFENFVEVDDVEGEGNHVHVQGLFQK